MAATTGTSSPCGACKFLRRKCAPDCVFAPYFCSELGPSRFAAIHKVFGASNISKLLLHLPAADRCEAVVTIAYEAQARLRDPVHGCVAHIFALQQQVASLQAQLMQVKRQMAQSLTESRSAENQWPLNVYNTGGDELQSMSFESYNNNTNYPATNVYVNPVSPQSSIESVDYNNDAMSMHEIQSKDDQLMLFVQAATRSHAADYSRTELGDLQSVAVRMMRN